MIKIVLSIEAELFSVGSEMLSVRRGDVIVIGSLSLRVVEVRL